MKRRLRIVSGAIVLALVALASAVVSTQGQPASGADGSSGYVWTSGLASRTVDYAVDYYYRLRWCVTTSSHSHRVALMSPRISNHFVNRAPM